MKGISLFVVPSSWSNDDGSLGERNSLSCGALEKKMGIHGNATCVMNYDGAKGWLVGEGEKGLQAMFIMMNAARLASAFRASRRAKSHIRTRQLRARAPAGQGAQRGRVRAGRQGGPDHRPSRCSPHADGVEGLERAGRALCLWASLLVDLSPLAGRDRAQQADDLLGLVTPVIKAYLTDKGFEAAVYAQQVFGGHGYIREHGMEQFVRDARITQIYEGTNGVQAMDLVGRKLPRDGGRGIRTFLEVVAKDIAAARDGATQEASALRSSRPCMTSRRATIWLAQHASPNPDNAGAGAYAYMDLMGLVSLGWMWLKMARAASDALASGGGKEGRDFYDAKLTTARFYAQRELPLSSALRRKIEAGAETLMKIPAEAF